MNKTQSRAYAQIIHAASMNRQAALQAELAVGFAVMLDAYPSKRLAKAHLQKIFNDAGCRCESPTDLNWKSVNRRIAASIKLFDFMGYDEVRGWAGELQKAPLIDALVEKLKPLKLKTVNEVLLICKGSKESSSSPRTGYVSLVGRKPGVKIETAHLKFNIPANTSPEELLEAAGKLMTMAQDLVNNNTREDASEPQVKERLAA